LRYVLQQNNKVYIPHYIYFETDEQISKIPHIDIFRTETHDVNEIVKNIIKHKPKVVFIDSLTNTIDLRITDIQKICDLLSKEFLDYDIFFVIDGSMMSGEIDLSFLIKNKSRIKILYYDSCSKYLQLGLDIAMGGLVVFPFNYQPVFDRLRRNTGTIMYDSVSNIFPIYTREVHQRRMRRFSENALLIGNMFLESQRLRKQVIPHFPLLKNHPDHLVALNHHSVGGLMTFSFPSNTYLNQRDSLNSFIEMALIIAKKFGVSLTKGVSFGFSIPRISAAAAMAENSPPFLRLSVGDRSYEETKLLGEALEQAFESYIKNAERMYDKER